MREIAGASASVARRISSIAPCYAIDTFAGR